MSTKGHGHVVMPPDLTNTVRERAGSLDLAFTTYLNALVIGAIRTGQADRLVMQTIEAGLLKRPQRAARRVQVPEREWTNIGRLQWRNGEFTMFRRGAGGHYGTPRPGMGWFLNGPGIDEPKFIGHLREEARDNAAPIIAAHLRKQSEWTIPASSTRNSSHSSKELNSNHPPGSPSSLNSPMPSFEHD